MGTSNFYKENANLYYVVLMNEDEWDNEMDLEWISNELQENGFDLNNSNSHSDILGTKTETFSQSDMNFYISIQAKINSGYYQGANLDWNVVVGLLMESILYRFDTENKIDSDNKLSRIFIILLWPLWIVMFVMGFVVGMIKEITKLFK